MKKIIPFLLFLALAGCAKKEWSKDYVAKKCNKERMKDASLELSKEAREKVCDCVADKMMAKYKSEAEADKDADGSAAVDRDCMGVLRPGEE